MPALLYQWIDLLWLPVGLAAVHKGQRLLTLGFIGTCILMLRAQVELMEHIGYGRGFLPGLLESAVYPRGLAVYGFFIALFLLLAYLSPRTGGVIYLAAAIGIFFVSFCVSMLVMFL